MAKKSQPVPVTPEQIERQLYVVRGQRVMLDSDLAGLYGIATAALNSGCQTKPSTVPGGLCVSAYAIRV